MAAQALREPAKEDATKLIADLLSASQKIKTGFGRLFKDTCP
jgi:hypothetical protein